MDFHAEISLLAFLGRVNLWIPLPFLVLSGTGRCDQVCIDYRDLPHRHASCTEVGFDGLNYLLIQPMLLQ